MSYYRHVNLDRPGLSFEVPLIYSDFHHAPVRTPTQVQGMTAFLNKMFGPKGQSFVFTSDCSEWIKVQSATIKDSPVYYANTSPK